MAVLWWAAERIDGVREMQLRTRVVLGCVGAMAWAAAIAIFFPDFFGGPMVDMDVRLVPIWLDHTSEFVPVASHERPMVVSLHMASSLLAVPAAVTCALRGDPTRRSGWRFLLGASLWFAGLTLFLHGRWALYLHLLVPIPLAWLLGRLVKSADTVGPPLLRTAAKVGSVTVVATFPFLFAVPLARVEAQAEGSGARSPTSCTASTIVPFLRQLESRRGAGIVLAPADWGPEIVFRTGHRAVASPYHRNANGLLDSHSFMSATDERAARAIAAQRGIDWVATCRQQPWFPVVGADEGRTLYGRLSAGQPPSWLRTVTLPDSLARSFRLFEVIERTP